VFQAGLIVGEYGSLTLTASGSWSYVLDNTNASVQALESAEMIAMPAAALEAVPQSIEVDAASLGNLLRAHGGVAEKKMDHEDGR